MTDAFAHHEFIGFVGEVDALFAATGLADLVDDGFVRLGDGGASPEELLHRCRRLRYWERDRAA